MPYALRKKYIMNKLIKIIIADDHLLFIDGLSSLLNGEDDIMIADIAYDGRQLLYILEKQSPDVILLDINMPGMNGLEALRYIKQSWPAINIVMLSTYNEEHLIEKAKQSGANGYLLKNCNKNELLQTIRLVSTGISCFPYQKPAALSYLDKEDKFLKQFSLSKRESEIIDLIKNEFTNQQIADQLHLSVYTIETHRKNIMQKLQLKSPAALIKFILENRL
jgi:DNA-binding NarL/FixJ family response regulator